VVLVPALVFAASPTEVAPAVCMPQTMLPPVVDQYDLIFRKAIVDTDRSKVVHRHEWNRRDTGSAAGKNGETGNKAKPDSCLHDLLRKRNVGQSIVSHKTAAGSPETLERIPVMLKHSLRG
jgi:hypothetical protein